MKNARLPTPITTADHGRRHSRRCRPFSIIQFWITKGTKINLSAVIRCFSLPPSPTPCVCSLSVFSFMPYTKPNGQSGFCFAAVEAVRSGEKHFKNQARCVWQWNGGPWCNYFFALFFFSFSLSFLLFCCMCALKFIYKHIFRRCHFQWLAIVYYCMLWMFLVSDDTAIHRQSISFHFWGMVLFFARLFSLDWLTGIGLVFPSFHIKHK